MSVQHSCPFRGYPEFYETAREFPAFAARCDEAFGWVADVAMRYVYRHYRQRVALGVSATGGPVTGSFIVGERGI